MCVCICGRKAIQWFEIQHLPIQCMCQPSHILTRNLPNKNQVQKVTIHNLIPFIIYFQNCAQLHSFLNFYRLSHRSALKHLDTCCWHLGNCTLICTLIEDNTHKICCEKKEKNDRTRFQLTKYWLCSQAWIFATFFDFSLNFLSCAMYGMNEM